MLKTSSDQHLSRRKNTLNSYLAPQEVVFIQREKPLRQTWTVVRPLKSFGFYGFLWQFHCILKQPVICQTQSFESAETFLEYSRCSRKSCQMHEWWLSAIVTVLLLASHSSWLKPVRDIWWQVFRQQGRRYTSYPWAGDDGVGRTWALCPHMSIHRFPSATRSQRSHFLLCLHPLQHQAPFCQLGELRPTWLSSQRRKNLPPWAHFLYQGSASTNTVNMCFVRMCAPALCWVSDDGAGPGSQGWSPSRHLTIFFSLSIIISISV